MSDNKTQPVVGSWSRDIQAREQPGAPLARPRRWTRWAGALVVLALFALGTPAPQAGIRRDEIECEEAVAHLAKCCPGFQPERYGCDYEDPVGCGDVTEPHFNVSKSREIRGMSCAEVLTTGLCDGTASP
ncbi:MAG TPA: hypothetical protein VNG33_10785 [Polyangiaceae bacterium]|nr:hypothetical protein [Polyangiaceae bacterium]